MGSFSAVHWLIVGAIALLLFGGGARLAGIGKGLGEGIKNFKKGIKDDDEPPKPLPAKEVTTEAKKISEPEKDEKTA